VRLNVGKFYVLIYENGKTRPVQTILVMEVEGIKEKKGGDELNYDIL
jgi:hypothetical protein